jgi:hypothetical protein
MRLIVFIAISLLSACLAFSVGKTAPKTNDNVVFVASAKTTTASAGGSVTVKFSLLPKDGFHINIENNPAMIVKIDSPLVASADGDPKITKRPKTVFLDDSKPVLQKLKLSNELKPGPVTIRGTLTYFYCSDKEGWCSKFTQPFEVEVKITKAHNK